MTKRSIIFLIFVILWMGVIFYMSNEDASLSDRESTDIVSFIIDKYDKLTNASKEVIVYHQSEEFMMQANYIFRKICHFSEYLILSILALLFIASINKFSIILCGIYSFLFSIFYAIIDEYHQTFILGRSGQISDIFIDSLGVLVGFVITILILKKIKNKRVLN